VASSTNRRRRTPSHTGAHQPAVRRTRQGWRGPLLAVGCLGLLAAALRAAPGGEAPERSANLQVAWVATLPEWREQLLVAAFPAGPVLLVQQEDQRLTALSPEDGRALWTLQPGRPLLGPPIAAGERVLLCFGDELLLVEAGSGQLVHRSLLPGEPSALPAADAELLYLPSVRQDRLHARWIEPPGQAADVARTPGRSGPTEAWSLVRPGGFRGGLLWLADPAPGLLVFGSGEGSLCALAGGPQPATSLLWELPLGGLVGQPVLHGDLLVVASAQQQVAAVQPATGRIVWRAAVDAPLRGTPLVSEGCVVVGSTGGCRALDLADGRLLWSRPILGLPLGSLPGLFAARLLDGSVGLFALADGSPRRAASGRRIACHADRLYDWSEGRRLRCLQVGERAPHDGRRGSAGPQR